MRKVIVIAEAGVNHNGSVDIAKQLIEKASFAGADFVKFQTFITELNISKSAKKAEYQKNNTSDDTSQFEMVKQLELSFSDFIELKTYCQKFDIGFLSTGFDLPSIDFLYDLIPFYKIPSGEITNKPYLIHVAKKGKPIILSTGMSTQDEIEEAIGILTGNGVSKNNITILHCNTEYPTPMEHVNLMAMLKIKNCLGVEVGYSDHTLGIEVPIAAVALGAVVIEKHFTLDRTLPGPDHAASLEPEELRSMIKAIKNIELAIAGSGSKEPSPSEISNKLIARKSIHTKDFLAKGHILTDEDLVMKRPGDGISPMEIDGIIGKAINQNLEAETKLKWEHLQK